MSLMIEMMDIAVQGVSHRWTPASGTCDAYGILRFGTSVRGVTVYFHKPAEIDEAIAELVALRAEMDPPVITDSERTCDQAHPETGAWCHRPAPHAEHRDTNGETWAAEPGVVRSAFPCCEHCTPACDGQGHGRPCTTPRCPAAQPAATGQGGVLFPAGDDEPTGMTDSEQCPAERIPGKPCSAALSVHLVHEGGSTAHVDADGIHWWTIQPQPACGCGHPSADHHLNVVSGERTDCNACDIGACDAFQAAAPASVTA